LSFGRRLGRWWRRALGSFRTLARLWPSSEALTVLRSRRL